MNAHWIDNADSYICSNCHYETNNPNKEPMGPDVCPMCKAKMRRIDMERLTVMTDKGAALKMGGSYESEQAARDDLMKRYRVAVARLAVYEDTGLEPEEIRELCTDDVAKIAKLFRHMIEDGSIDHLQALLEAEKAGRLVVLPCKVGDTIYQLRKPGHARGPGVSPRIVSCIEIRGRDYAVCHQGMEPCLKRDLGKTWFLTLQEADEALRKEADND